MAVKTVQTSFDKNKKIPLNVKTKNAISPESKAANND